MRPLQIPSRHRLVSHICNRAHTPSTVSQFHRTAKKPSPAPSDLLSADAEPGWRSFSFSRGAGYDGKTMFEDISRGEVSAQTREKGMGNGNCIYNHIPPNQNPLARANKPIPAIHKKRFSTNTQVQTNQHTSSSSVPHPPTSEQPHQTPSPASPAPVTMTDREKGENAAKNPSPGALAGKRCLITGASRGIGKAIAARFAHEGARCVLVGRRGETLLGVVGELRGCDGTSASGAGAGAGRGHGVVEGDVGEAEFWEGFRKETDIDILVNCAGVAHYSPLVATSAASVEKTVQTNLLGTMLGCRMVGRNMMRRRQASLLGLKGGKGSAAYAASKAGVIALTRALAAELGEKNVRVNVIVPGYVETSMTRAMTPDAHYAALNAIPLKRFGLPSEIADAAVFLATNKYASNCVLNLDGGLSAT
ncbi:Carbonyl reductase family member 4 [Lachnellula arida]|uniref:Carbonyl reductase family member 4 n=1 Tax=Lachnellula arida TaxID=1316785 RepID=A0A8T9BNR5_9HELO|nr:Carbonyl reductase family member 4 [Lachnellula arida]